MTRNNKCKKWLITVTAIAVTCLVIFVAAVSIEKPKTYHNGVVLFYQDNCSHCTAVNDYLVKNNIEETVKLTKLNVTSSNTNRNVLADKVQTCGLDYSHIGVPFLWTGKNCIIGDINIINYFKKNH